MTDDMGNLVLERRYGEDIVLSVNGEVMARLRFYPPVLGRGRKVRVRVHAPQFVDIWRAEVWDSADGGLRRGE